MLNPGLAGKRAATGCAGAGAGRGGAGTTDRDAITDYLGGAVELDMTVHKRNIGPFEVTVGELVRTGQALVAVVGGDVQVIRVALLAEKHKTRGVLKQR